jgi:hypothetical protein
MIQCHTSETAPRVISSRAPEDLKRAGAIQVDANQIIGLD